MKCHFLVPLLLVVAWMNGETARAQSLQTIQPDQARKVAEVLLPETVNLADLQVAIQGDASKARGIRIDSDGILIVPQKGINEETEDPDVDTAKGAALAYLFMTEKFAPLVDGTMADDKELRHITVIDDDGASRKIKVFLLAARRLPDDQWRLYVYAKGNKPLAEGRFDEAPREDPEANPVGIQIDDIEGTRGTLYVTVFGKYRAGFRIGYQE